MSAPAPPPPPPPPMGLPSKKTKAPLALDASVPASTPKRVQNTEKQVDFLEQLKARQATRGASGNSDFMAIMRGDKKPSAEPVKPSQSFIFKKLTPVSPAPSSPTKQEENAAASSPKPKPTAAVDFMSIMRGDRKPSEIKQEAMVMEKKESVPVASTFSVKKESPAPLSPLSPMGVKKSPASPLPVRSFAEQNKSNKFLAKTEPENELAAKLRARQVKNQELLEQLDTLEKKDQPKWVQEEEQRKQEEVARRKIEEDLKRQELEKKMAELDAQKAKELRKQHEAAEAERKLEEQLRLEEDERKRKKELEIRNQKEDMERRKREEEEKQKRDAEIQKKKEESKNKVKSDVSKDSMEHMRTGNAAFTKNDISAAISSFTAAINSSPQFSQPYLFRGICLLNTRKAAEAIPDFSAAIEHSELDEKLRDVTYRGHLLRGKCHKQLKHYDEAIEDFNRALDLSQNDAAKLPVFTERALCFDYTNKFVEAVADYRHWLELAEKVSPKPTAFLMYSNYHNCAMALVSLKKNDEAIDYFSKAIHPYVEQLVQDNNFANQQTSFADTYYNRGKCYDFAGQSKSALSDFEQATVLHPNHTKSLFFIGNLRYAKKEYQEACDAFSVVIDADNQDLMALYNRGMCCMGMEKYIAAQNDFLGVQDMNPDYYRAYIKCAQSMRLSQMQTTTSNEEQDESTNQEIIEQYTKAIEAVEQDEKASQVVLPALYFERSTVYANMKKSMEALEDLGKTIELDPVHSDAYYNRADLLHH